MDKDLFTLDPFKDEKIIVENKNANVNDLFYLEGWKDVLKKGIDIAKNTIKRIKMLPRVPKSPLGCDIIHSIILRMKPNNIPGIPILGTPFRLVKKDNEYVIENGYYSITEKDISETFLSEGFFGSGNKTIEEKINKFAKKNNVETIIAKPGSALEANLKQVQTPAIAVMMNESNEKQFRATGDIAKLTSGGYNGKALIVYSPAVFPPNAISDKLLDHMLYHEFGHVKTFHLVTDDDWTEYYAKSGMIRMLWTINPSTISVSDGKELTAVMNAIYANLKPEKLANDYSKLDFRFVLRELYRVEVPDDWRSRKIARLIDLKIPSDVLSIYDKLSKAISYNATKDMYIRLMENAIDIYNELLEEKFANPIIKELKYGLENLKSIKE